MRRAHKFLVTLAVVAAAILLIVWNTSAETASPAMGVTQAKRDAHNLDGQDVQVRGLVLEPSIVANESRVDSFVIADSLEQLQVRYGHVPPDNFGPKEVVVNGRLTVDGDGAVVLEALSIQVGCSSKY